MKGMSSSAGGSSTAHPPEGYHSFLLGDTTFTVKKRYTNLRLIGAGAQGAVVSAVDNQTGRNVAIKKFLTPFENEIYAKRAYREFFYMRVVRHKNIIKLLHAFSPQTSLDDFSEVYLVMELMSASLSRLSSGSAPLSHDHLSFLTYQLLCGIKHLHAGGIIHRDLKPTNVVVDEKCNLKILDFGLARSAETRFQLTRYVVTRYYRAPEVILCDEYTEKVDVWAVGCILSELILRRILFKGADQVDQWKKISHVLGSPDDSFLMRLHPNVAEYLRSEQSQAAVPWTQLFPDQVFPEKSATSPVLNNDNARDLLSKLLVVDPMRRISVDEALRHPYLHLWFDNAEVNGEMPVPFDHSVDDLDLPVAEWRKRLFYELKSFEAATAD